jgi:hypothetical protein
VSWCPLRSDRRRLAAFQSPPCPLKNGRRVGFQAALYEPPDDTAEHAAQHVHFGSTFPRWCGATPMPPQPQSNCRAPPQIGTPLHSRDPCCRFFGSLSENRSRTGAVSGIPLATLIRRATMAVHRVAGCGEPVDRNHRPTLCPRVHAGCPRRRFAWTRPPNRRLRHGAHASESFAHVMAEMTTSFPPLNRNTWPTACAATPLSACC